MFGLYRQASKQAIIVLKSARTVLLKLVVTASHFLSETVKVRNVGIQFDEEYFQQSLPRVYSCDVVYILLCDLWHTVYVSNYLF